jgi:HEPN domain-containing protein
MKKFFTSVLLFSVIMSVFAVSYTNNTYQKLANEYAKKAEMALDAGHYEESVEYSKLAEENAILSREYTEMMLARKDAEDNIKLAKNKLAWAEKVDAPNIFPMAYSAGKENIENADASFGEEDYPKASDFAKQALAALDGIVETTPLPEFYIVRPWAETKDCYWNISGRHYVYNNPLLWENLYQANKDKMPKPEDPNLIHPGMKMKIPSITGEYRKGTYDSKKEYNAYGE